MKTKQLVILPVRAVLFPQGKMQLTLSDPNYIKYFLYRKPHTVGLVLSTPPETTRFNDAIAPNAPYIENIGCQAKVTSIEINAQQPNQLIISLIGEERFQVTKITKNTYQCWQAKIDTIPNEAFQSIPMSHFASVKVLIQIIAEEEAIAESAKRESKILFPYDLENAAWVSNRLAELLAIPLKAQQKLMELESGHSRLEIIQHYLHQHQVI